MQVGTRKRIIPEESRRKFFNIGNELSVQGHIMDNLDVITEQTKWGPIREAKEQFFLKIGPFCITPDIFIWHSDNTTTMIEVKKFKGRELMAAAIGQILQYGTVIKSKFGELPRMVIASDFIPNSLMQTIQEFKLPIHVMEIDGDEGFYY